MTSAGGRDDGAPSEGAASPPADPVRDAETGVVTRAVLFDRVERAAHGLYRRGGGHGIALVVVRVHLESHRSVRPETLRGVASRIRTVVRPADTVARVGDATFAVLCDRLVEGEDVLVVAHRMATALGALRTTIWTTTLDRHTDPAPVLRDLVGSDGTPTGRTGAWSEFVPELRRRAAERAAFESDLRAARDGDGLELVHQPVVELATGSIAGFEALLRWRRNDQLVHPSSFVPLAESTGLIVPIGAWALRAALVERARWWAAAGGGPRVGVNLSAHQVRDPGIVELVERSLAETGTAADRLWLEITETVLLDEPDTVTVLEQLRALGVGIVLDDFGTGYSSLTYLRRFPVDTVKLDRSYVAGVADDDRDAAIVRALVELTAALGIDCVAEGVETPAQHAALVGLGCRYGQGRYVSDPVPAPAAAGFVAAAGVRSSPG